MPAVGIPASAARVAWASRARVAGGTAPSITTSGRSTSATADSATKASARPAWSAHSDSIPAGTSQPESSGGRDRPIRASSAETEAFSNSWPPCAPTTGMGIDPRAPALRVGPWRSAPSSTMPPPAKWAM